MNKNTLIGIGVVAVIGLAVFFTSMKQKTFNTVGEKQAISQIKGQTPRIISDRFSIFGKPMKELSAFEQIRTPSVQAKKSMGTGSISTKISQAVLPTNWAAYTLGLNPYTKQALPIGSGMKKATLKKGIPTTEKNRINTLKLKQNQNGIYTGKYEYNGKPLFDQVYSILPDLSEIPAQ